MTAVVIVSLLGMVPSRWLVGDPRCDSSPRYSEPADPHGGRVGRLSVTENQTENSLGLCASAEPLLQAGVPSVVASQWRIGDRSTMRLIQAFYQELAKGLPVGDALRAAKLDALRRGVPPREWAAFTIVGDPLVTVPLRAPWPNAWRSAVLIASLGLGAAGIAYWHSRRRATRKAG